MHPFKIHFAIAAASAALLITAAIPAPAVAAEAKLVAGTLTCKGHGTVGLIIGSQETLDCDFNPAAAGRHHRYVATVTKVGLDVGIKGPSVLIWTVLAPSTTVHRGALVGGYGGVSADASVGIGGGANLLLGGSNKSFALQPLSVQGQTGLNLAVGVAEMTLRRG